MMASEGSEKIPADAQGILHEIRRAMGFLPPPLQALAQDAEALRAAWLCTRAGYIENALPQLFKEQFMVLIAKYQLSTSCLILRSCALHRMGMEAPAIIQLLQQKLPPQSVILEQLRNHSPTWTIQSGWMTMPSSLEQSILFASVRMTLRKDPGGRCRQALRELLGFSNFNKILLLSTFAAMQRIWVNANPDLDPLSDPLMHAQYQSLLDAAPEFASVVDASLRRSARPPVSARERKLLAEIARQNRIRQKLRDSDHRFKRIVRNAAYPVMIYAEDGQVVMINRAWRTLSGWSRKSIPNIRAWARHAEVDKAGWSRKDLDALDGWDEVIEEGEHRIRTPSGQVRRWDFSTAALGKLSDGRRAYMRMAVDVTERRDLEAALWSTNRRVTHILESISDGFIVLDREHRFTWINPQAAELLGRDPNAILGRTIEDALPGLVPEAIYDQGMQSLVDGQPRHFEYFSQYLHLPIEAHALGTAEGLWIQFRDIRGRKDLQARALRASRLFELLFQSAPQAMILLDEEATIQHWNPAAQALLGFSSDDVHGRLSPTIPPQDADAFKANLKELAGGRMLPLRKIACPTRHAAPITCTIHGRIINDDDGNFLAYLETLIPSP